MEDLIRWLNEYLIERFIGCPNEVPNDECLKEAVGILQYLTSQGVVQIDKEAELPEITQGCSCELCENYRKSSAIPYRVLLGAGWSKTKPLEGLS